MSDAFRLPDSIRPRHYRLALAPDLAAGTFEGRVVIDLDIRARTDTVTLNSVGLAIKRATLGGQPLTVNVDEKAERVAFVAPEPVHGPSTIDIEFSAALSSDMRGFYKSSYTRADGSKATLATTQFEAASARRAFPCFDEPSLKATFEVEMTVPEDRLALSNTDPVSSEPAGAGRKRVRFAKTPVMSTYLLAFVVGEFDRIEAKTKDGTPVRVYTMPGRSALGRFGLEAAVRGLDFFGEYYAIPYRDALAKVDLVAVPDFEAGAMENWGLITFREVALFVDPEKSSVPQRRRVAEVVLHELAHQWFGNLVTMQWWNELWLNESFATFMAYKAADALFPEWKVWEEYVSQTTSEGKSLDALRSSHPIEVPVKDPSEVDQIFDAISYNKGGSVLRMLEAAIGADVFRNGIRGYLKKHRYANASTRDLWNALSESSGQDVASMMATWTGQVGFPVVVATRQGGKLALKQERFLIDRDPEKPAEDPTLWTIPVVGTGGVAVRLERREQEVDAPAGTKLNAGQTGFYRVQYDADTRRALAAASQSLPPDDRYGLLEDGSALMRAGYLSVGDFLDLAAAYEPEEKYHVWAMLTGGLSMLGEVFVGDAHVPALDRWAAGLLKGIVKTTGWDAAGGDSHDRLLLRSVVLGAAARFGAPDVVAEARARFDRAVKDGSPERVPADLRGVVFGAVARHGDAATFESLAKLVEKADLPEVRATLLRAIGGFRSDELVRRALDFALSEKVRPQDAMYTFFGTPIETRRAAWSFVKERWEALSARYGKSWMLGRIIEGAASGIPDEEHAKDVEAFFAKNPAPYATERIKQTLEGVRARAKFRRRHADALAERFAGGR